jgi:integrase
MAKALTPIKIASLRAHSERYEISDPGCQGLRICVFPSGKLSFVLRFRYRGVSKKLTLGPVLLHRSNGEGEPDTPPELGTPLSLAAARELATKALRQARSGTDPAAAKQRQRQEQLAAESDTLQAVAQEYLRRVGPKLRTLDQRKADLDLLCASALGRLPIREIRRGQYTRVFDHVADHNGPVRADRVLSATKTLLAWHAERSDFISPLGRGGRRTSILERARTRVLSDDELRALWLAAEQDQRLFGAYVRFLLLTATRRSEAAGFQRSELSADGKTWTIPALRCKTKRDVVLPLSKAAQKIIAAQPLLGDFIFSATGKNPLGDFTRRKAAFDQLSGVGGYGLHDLRRTSRTLLSRAGVNSDTAERCLGHTLTGVRAVYDQHPYIEEMRDAFERLSALIERIVHPSEPPVTHIAEARERRRK